MATPPAAAAETTYLHYCPLCKRGFNKTSTYKHHCRSTIHEGVRPWQCLFCTHASTRKQDHFEHIDAHIQKLLNQKNHFCDTCGEGFTRAKSVKRHSEGTACERRVKQRALVVQESRSAAVSTLPEAAPSVTVVAPLRQQRQQRPRSVSAPPSPTQPTFGMGPESNVDNDAIQGPSSSSFAYVGSLSIAVTDPPSTAVTRPVFGMGSESEVDNDGMQGPSASSFATSKASNLAVAGSSSSVIADPLSLADAEGSSDLWLEGVVPFIVVTPPIEEVEPKSPWYGFKNSDEESRGFDEFSGTASETDVTSGPGITSSQETDEQSSIAFSFYTGYVDQYAGNDDLAPLADLPEMGGLEGFADLEGDMDAFSNYTANMFHGA